MPIAKTPPNKYLRFTLVFLVFLGFGTLIASILLPPPSRTTTPTQSELAHWIPPFELTERSGQTISNKDLLGKVWVASFVFVRCTGPCPSVTATMARLQSELDLANTPDLRLVTFTVDPERDTPEDLRQYAEHYQAHPERWLFVRAGNEAEMHQLAQDGFFIGVNRSTSENPPAGQEFDHSTRLVVVDKQGRVRGFFDGYRGEHDSDGSKYESSLTNLKTRVGELLKR
jgi:protein SCO1